jgi:hypothetical protein
MFTTLIPVNSSAIRAVGYDGYTLTVEFHSGRNSGCKRCNSGYKRCFSPRA